MAKKRRADLRPVLITTVVFMNNLCLTSTIKSHNDRAILHQRLLKNRGINGRRTQKKKLSPTLKVERITLTMLERMHHKCCFLPQGKVSNVLGLPYVMYLSAGI